MRFQKGNKGKPKGTKSKKTIQWEQLQEDIVGYHSERFNRRLVELMESEDPKIALKGMEMFCNVLEYFKPKQSRITHAGEKESPINIIIAKNL